MLNASASIKRFMGLVSLVKATCTPWFSSLHMKRRKACCDLSCEFITLGEMNSFGLNTIYPVGRKMPSNGRQRERLRINVQLFIASLHVECTCSMC